MGKTKRVDGLSSLHDNMYNLESECAT